MLRHKEFLDEDLSTREIEVLHQLVEGKTNKEIGSALAVSKNTVEFHLKNLYRKLNVQTRT